MGILSNIFAKIFPRSHPAVTESQTRQAPTAALQPVDVEAILDGKARKGDQTLNWRSSIADLMKLLGLDSDLQSRKALAAELGYSGDMGDSATMNIWLHKQVLTSSPS